MAEHALTVACDRSGNAVVKTRDGRQLAVACTGTSLPAFSSTELLQAALAGCVTASVAPLLARHGADAASLRVTVTVEDASLARGVAVGITLPACDDELLARCRRAVANCPVRQALNIPVDIQWQTD